MFRLIILALIIAFLKTPGALGDDIERDGVLPLRLPGDGVMPLRLSGDATQGTTRTATQVSITSASQSPMSTTAGASLTCRITGANITKHVATGTVLVGLAQYVIIGICYNQDTAEMEVVAERSGTGERSFMAGGLTDPEPRSFAGRLTVTGTTPPAGTYNFNVQSENLHGGGEDRI